MTEKEIKILDDAQARADAFLATELNVARNQALNLIKSGSVSLNGKPLTKPSVKLNLGDVLRIKFEQSEPDRAKFEAEFEVPIIYEDLLVLNKPANLVVHPAPSVKEPTLVDWLGTKGFLLSNLSGQSRAGIVHRLDKGTSGAIVVAKNNAAHAALSSQLSDKSMGRIYLTLTDLPLKQNCIVERAIGRNPAKRRSSQAAARQKAPLRICFLANLTAPRRAKTRA